MKESGSTKRFFEALKIVFLETKNPRVNKTSENMFLIF